MNDNFFTSPKTIRLVVFILGIFAGLALIGAVILAWLKVEVGVIALFVSLAANAIGLVGGMLASTRAPKEEPPIKL